MNRHSAECRVAVGLYESVGRVARRADSRPQGATHPNLQAALGVPGPVAARPFEPAVAKGSQSLPDVYSVRGLEAEYAFLLGSGLPPDGAPYSRRQIADAVASLRPAIEIVDTRFTGPQKGLIAIADNVNDGYWIYGEGVGDWRGLDITDTPASMAVNGSVVGDGSGAEVLGDPFSSLCWLINDRAAGREGVRAGQFITTGSCTGLYRAPAACEATANFGELGELSVRFVV